MDHTMQACIRLNHASLLFSALLVFLSLAAAQRVLGCFITAAETQPTCRAQVQLLELEKRKKSKYDGPGLHGEGLKVGEFREQDGASSKLRWLNHDEGSDGRCSGSYRGGGGHSGRGGGGLSTPRHDQKFFFGFVGARN
jgi:hypothetical protein